MDYQEKPAFSSDEENDHKVGTKLTVKGNSKIKTTDKS